MIAIQDAVKGFKTAESRWARFGPYYAMFPVNFAFEVVQKYSSEGDYILDPFAGRCSSIYAGGVLGRHSLGIEINPVGWIYGKTKLNPAEKNDVVNRLSEIYKKRNNYTEVIDTMSEFYRICYCDEVLKFLLSARKNLDWKNSNVDATLMSMILVSLHNKIGAGLSNQMMMTKAMGINYSVKWWKEKGLTNPPKINPEKLLLSKIEWRYKKGMPKVTKSSVVCGDSTIELKKINDIKFSLLFTSPPYYSITNYHTDQWLRLWMLGGSEEPKTIKEKYKGRFIDKESYYNLLDNVFSLSAQMMKKKNTIYVRTDKREFTLNTTVEILEKHFPNHKKRIKMKPLKENTRTQAKLYGDKSMKPGEVDIILKS